MKIRNLGLAAIAAVLLATSAHAASDVVAADHFKARVERYDVRWSGISLGEGTISLKPDGDGCFKYVSTTDPIAIVRWVYGAPREESHFCLVDGQVQAGTFAYVNNKRPDDSFHLDFNWDSSQLKVLKDGELSIRKMGGAAYDRFVIREAIRLWVIRYEAGQAPAEADFALANHDKTKTYRFGIKGEEVVKTSAGDFTALRVDRIDNPKRMAHYWLAPKLDYVPVLLEQYKGDDLELRMDLLSAGTPAAK